MNGPMQGFLQLKTGLFSVNVWASYRQKNKEKFLLSVK